jgi:predicted RNA-binding protein with PUA-like domain
MGFWLLKSEPDAFSWDQQVANGTEPWTGVRNHMAKANLAAMKAGDLAFFYHSNIGKEIVGVVEVVREAYPDPTAEPIFTTSVSSTSATRPTCPTATTRRPADATFSAN